MLDRLKIINSTEYDDLSDRVVSDYTKDTSEDAEPDGVSINLQPDDNDENTNNIEDVPEGYVYDTHQVIDTLEPVPYRVGLSWTLDNYGRYYVYKNAMDWGHTDNYWYWFPIQNETQQSISLTMLDNQRGLFLGNREFEINANLNSVPLHLQGTTIYDQENYMPKVKMPGNSYQHRQFNDFSLRLLLYAGVRDVEGTVMPSADITYGDVTINAFWSYNHRWKEYIEWYKKASRETYEIELKLSASEIKNFDFSRKKLINGQLFFITNMQIQLTRNEIKPVKCTMIKAE